MFVISSSLIMLTRPSVASSRRSPGWSFSRRVWGAGLSGMPMRKFTAALTIGSVPTAFAFAALGAGWADQPIVALAVSYLLPILLLPITRHLMRVRAR